MSFEWKTLSDSYGCTCDIENFKRIKSPFGAHPVNKSEDSTSSEKIEVLCDTVNLLEFEN